MNPYKLFHIIYLPIAAILFLITCYYSTGLAEFEREDGFGKDLRIALPEYVIEDRQLTSIYENEDESGLFLYDSLAYSIRLMEQLPDKSLRVITSERRGWERVDDDTYALRRSILSEVMKCKVDVRDCVMMIAPIAIGSMNLTINAYAGASVNLFLPSPVASLMDS